MTLELCGCVLDRNGGVLVPCAACKPVLAATILVLPVSANPVHDAHERERETGLVARPFGSVIRLEARGTKAA